MGLKFASVGEALRLVFQELKVDEVMVVALAERTKMIAIGRRNARQRIRFMCVNSDL